jgi:outer membrane protein assembly factor BamB
VNLLKRYFVPFLLSALAGCAIFPGQSGKGSGIAELPNFKASSEVRQVWREQVGAAQGFVFTPALLGGSLFAAGREGQIVRLDADSGAQVWRIDSGAKLSAGIGGNDSLLLVGTDKGEVLAFNHDGKPQWRAKVSSEVLSAPQVAEDIVVARAGDGRIYGLDARDGKQKWVYQRAMPPLSLRNHAGVTLTRGAVLAGFPGGKLVALNVANGTVGWEATVALPRGATELERIADIASPPVADEGMVCAVAFQGRLACFDLFKGNPLWVREISSISGLSMDRRYLYISDAKGAVHALDKNSGASIWKQDKLSGRQLTAPLVFGGQVAVADYRGYVHFLADQDGGFVARGATDGHAVVAPLVAQRDRLFLQTANGGLFALALQ